MAIANLLIAGLMAATPNPAPEASKCKVKVIAELPVTMVNHRPMIAAKFGDRDARFIVDSGAFYSTISKANAAEYGLSVQSLPPWFTVRGIGGTSSAGYVNSSNFSLAGIKWPKTDFVVGGSDTGTSGLLGQNILGLADIEYDLPHGAIRMMRTTRCAKTGLAYWAKGKPFTEVPLESEPNSRFRPHTVAVILVNGIKVKATFDSGAAASLMSLSMAKRLGVTPTSSGVEPEGFSSGLGSRRVTTWIAPFEKIDIGGEVINHPKIRIAEVQFGEADMLIGVDFFLTHRMFVSNTDRKLYITYEGGPVFGLSPRNAFTSDGKVLDLTDKTAPPATAEEFSRRGAALMSNRRVNDALTDFDRAIAMAPGEGRYFVQRAAAHLASGQGVLARADLDKAIELAPGDVDARLMRAGLRLRTGDRDGAGIDLKEVDGTLAPSSAKRLTLAAMYNEVGVPEVALANYDLWFKDHAQDSARISAFNGRCWARALLNRELDKALSDCNTAIKLQPNQSAYLDSRALVRFRRGELPAALADYDAAITLSPRNAWSLYARGLVEAKLGAFDRAKVDRAAALAIAPKIGERARRFGLEP